MMSIMNRHPRPIGSNVLVRLKRIDEEKEVKTDWGFHLKTKSDDLLSREQRATKEAYVIAIGKDAFHDFDGGEEFKIGDLVLIAKYAGDDMDDIVEGEVFRIVNPRQIQVVFEGEGKFDGDVEHE